MTDVPFQSILCPVDFSKCSSNALRVGARLSFTTGKPLKIIHATHFDVPPYLTEKAQVAIADELANARREAKEKLAEWATPYLPEGLAPEYEIIERPAVDAIRQAADAMPGCWIVMGTHGRTGVRRLLIGSVTERTLRETHVPTLTIPPGAEPC